MVDDAQVEAVAWKWLLQAANRHSPLMVSSFQQKLRWIMFCLHYGILFFLCKWHWILLSVRTGLRYNWQKIYCMWKWKSLSCVRLFATPWSDSLWPHGLYSPWDSPGQNTGVGNLSLLQGIFPTQGSNPGLPRCRQILYQLSHQGNPKLYMLRVCNMNRFDTRYALRTFTSVKAMSIPVTFRDLFKALIQ